MCFNHSPWPVIKFKWASYLSCLPKSECKHIQLYGGCHANETTKQENKPNQTKTKKQPTEIIWSWVLLVWLIDRVICPTLVLPSSGSKPGRYDSREHGWESDVAGAGGRGEVPGESMYAWIKHLCLPGTVPGIRHTQTQMTLATNTGDKNCPLWFHARTVKLEGKTDYVTGPPDDTAGVEPRVQPWPLTCALSRQVAASVWFPGCSGKTFQRSQGMAHWDTTLCGEEPKTCKLKVPVNYIGLGIKIKHPRPYPFTTLKTTDRLMVSLIG